MARPKKWRRVCCLPESSRFGPLDIDADDTVTITVDEFESIRLIDVDGLTQEECAEQMDVSRTTVQGIYFSARKKLGESLANGKVLIIEGGEYRLCDGEGHHCRRTAFGRQQHRCHNNASHREAPQSDLAIRPGNGQGRRRRNRG